MVGNRSETPRRPWEDPRVVAGTERLLARRAELLGAGARAVGWKLAFGTPAALAALGLTGPVVGFLTSATVLESGAARALTGWTAPKLEAEIAITVGPGGGVAAVAPAIELADADAPPTDTEAVLAGDIYHRAVVLGEPGERPPRPYVVTVRRGGDDEDGGDEGDRDAEGGGDDDDGGDGEGGGDKGDRGDEGGGGDERDCGDERDDDGDAVATCTDAEAVVGDLDELTAYVAAYLGHFGQALAPGDTIISGSTVPLLDIAAGERWRVRLEGRGEVAVGVTA